jgi:hypothetical protein
MPGCIVMRLRGGEWCGQQGGNQKCFVHGFHSYYSF